MNLLAPPELLAYQMLSSIRESAKEAGPMSPEDERDFYILAIDDVLHHLAAKMPTVHDA